jgi:UDP-N-acetylmuramoylalanine--D-glutamate ligase
MEVKGVSFTVVGAGRSGIAAANLLARRGGDVVLTEGRAEVDRPEALHPDVSFVSGSNAARPGDVAVLSPGIPEVSPVRAEIAGSAAEVMGEVELFFRLCPATVLAITGTDGKSTTTTMLGAISEASGRPTFVGGNLGNPLTDDVDRLGADHVVVAEVSAFQLTTCETFRPSVAIVTNISQDHLDYHGGYEPYQAAKRRVFARMGDGDTLIVNADDPIIAGWSLPSGPEIQTFSLVDEGATGFLRGSSLMVHVDGRPTELMDRSELRVLGIHNVANALAAGLAGLAAGFTLEMIRTGLSGYEALPHRMETVAHHEQVRWVNDSKATNVNAASAGISSMEGSVILLAGGSDKDADFSEFGQLVRERAKDVILFGATRERLAEAIGDDHVTAIVADLQEAFDLATMLAKAGDTVLLSPACASFDQFRSYEHRGDVFRELAQTLQKESTP